MLRFDEFRELAEDFLEGNSDFHGKTRDTLHQCWIEQYHLLPYGLVHYGGGGGGRGRETSRFVYYREQIMKSNDSLCTVHTE